MIFKSENWGSICSSGNKMTWAPHLTSAGTKFFCVHLQVTEFSGQWLLRQKEGLSYKPFCRGKFCSEKLTYAWLQHWSHVSVTTWLTLHLVQHVELNSTEFRINSTRYWGGRTGSQSWSNIKSSASFHRKDKTHPHRVSQAINNETEKKLRILRWWLTSLLPLPYKNRWNQGDHSRRLHHTGLLSAMRWRLPDAQLPWASLLCPVHSETLCRSAARFSASSLNPFLLNHKYEHLQRQHIDLCGSVLDSYLCEWCTMHIVDLLQDSKVSSIHQLVKNTRGHIYLCRSNIQTHNIK